MIMSWVLFTQHRFGWGSWENGWLLATVGVLSAVVQGGLLGTLVKRFGEAKLAILSLMTGVIANALYGLATEGWMMYAILIATCVGFTGGPAIQGIISKTTDASVQGVTMGALTAIGSLTGSFAPILASTILSHVLQYPPSDVRIGAVFFLCSALDVVALILIWSHLRSVGLKPAPTIGDAR
jgi:DHA1 family tetracycline resistance protein-like MFS transporter